MRKTILLLIVAVLLFTAVAGCSAPQGTSVPAPLNATVAPTAAPTQVPTAAPTLKPTVVPTKAAASLPSASPAATLIPSASPAASEAPQSTPTASVAPVETSVFAPLTPTAPAGKEYAIVDSHLHYLSFIQKTDGFPALLAKLDEANVAAAVVFGMPIVKLWDENSQTAPTYYLDNDAAAYYFSGTDYIMLNDLRALPASDQARFYPFVCGVNANDRYSASYLERLIKQYPEIAGIGEIMLHHDDLTAYTYGEAPRADSAAMLAIYDLAAKYELPVLLHDNISSANNDYPLYLEEMKAALAHNRDTKIIWAHVGISRRVTITNLATIADELLKNNSNLYFDISWLVYDDYIAADELSMKRWAALIEKWPDRFMIGTDVVGSFTNYVANVTKYYELLDLLQPATAEKLCSTNILSLVNRVGDNALAATPAA